MIVTESDIAKLKLLGYLDNLDRFAYILFFNKDSIILVTKSLEFLQMTHKEHKLIINSSQTNIDLDNIKDISFPSIEFETSRFNNSVSSPNPVRIRGTNYECISCCALWDTKYLYIYGFIINKNIKSGVYMRNDRFIRVSIIK